MWDVLYRVYYSVDVYVYCCVGVNAIILIVLLQAVFVCLVILVSNKSRMYVRLLVRHCAGCVVQGLSCVWVTLCVGVVCLVIPHSTVVFCQDLLVIVVICK